MLKTVELINFRGFRSAKLANLARVNVITGVNGAGKTSLLEAVFLNCGAANAALAASLAGFRGDNTWGMKFSLPFATLFRNLEPSVHPRVVASTSALQRTKKHLRDLEIRPSYSQEESAASTTQKLTLSGVEFLFKGPSGPERGQFGWRITQPRAGMAESMGNDAAGRVSLGGDPVPNKDLIQANFVSPYVRDIVTQNYQMLTQLTKERRIDEVVNALRIVHPSIKDIVPLTENGIEVVYVDVGQSNLQPISLLGAGVTNVLHIVLPLIIYKNAVVLIDEFEDGLHHSLFRPLLRMVFEVSAANRNQVFLSSHSEEFLRALISEAVETNENGLSFYRLSKRSMEGVVPRFSLEEVRDLVDSDLELR